MTLTPKDLEQINKLIQNNNTHIEYYIDTKTEDLKDDFDEKMQQVKSDIIDKIDPVLKEVQASQQERVIINERLTKLEEAVFQS